MRALWMILLAIVTAICGRAAAAEPGILQLTAQPVKNVRDENTAGHLLLRELQRQAVLIAARDELGLRTRDMAMGELFTPHGKDGVTTILMETAVTRGVAAQSCLAIFEGEQPAEPYDLAAKVVDDAGNKILLRTKFELPAAPRWVDYKAFVEATAKQSSGEYVEALKKIGAAGKPVEWKAGDASPKVLELLGAMNPFSQMAAVRMQHEQIRSQGASAARMEALVRGYANLGMMTHTLWNGTSKVYFARALLYAERLAAHEKNSTQSIYVRAYARAMTGLHAAALEDFATAAKDPAAKVPEWKKAVEAYCRYDLKSADPAAADKEFKALAGFLAFMIAEDAYSPERYEQAGITFLKNNADCFAVMSRLWEQESLGMTARMPQMLMMRLPASAKERLAAAGLPADLDKLRDAIEAGEKAGGKQLAAFSAGLEEFSKSGKDMTEPSLGAMASMIRDEEFLYAVYTTMYLQHYLGTDFATVKRNVEATRAMWEKHPLGAYVESHGVERGDDVTYKATIDKIKLRDGGGWTAQWMVGFFRPVSFNEKNDWYRRGVAEMDLIPTEMTVRAMDKAGIHRWKMIAAARQVSPFGATLFRGWMESYPPELRHNDPALVRATVKEAAEKFDGKMRVIRWAAMWASGAGDWKTAMQMLEKVQKQDPSMLVAQLLADNYYALRDAEKLTEVADKGMELPSTGLSASSLAGSTSYQLLLLGKDKDAMAFAQEASGSYSYMGLTYYANTLLRRGKTEDAAGVIQARAERYPETGNRDWYFWAKRTKDASFDKAKEAAGDIIDPTEDPAAAVEVHRQKARGYYNADNWVAYAIDAAAMGDQPQMSYALGQASRAPSGREYGNRMRALQDGSNIKWALLNFDAYLANQSSASNEFFCLAQTGRLMAAMGRKAEALPYLKRAIRYPNESQELYYFVWKALEKLGEDPAKLAKAGPDKPAEIPELMGEWVVDVLGTADVWKFAADGTVTVKGTQEIGRWFGREKNVVIAWSATRWASFDLPLGEKVTGDSWKGAGMLQAHKAKGEGAVTRAAVAIRPGVIDLLNLVKAERDGLNGNWIVVDGALTCGALEFAKLELPYEPAEEYDFRIVFTRLDGFDSVGQACVGGAGRQSFLWEMDGFSGEFCGFNQVGGKAENQNPTGKKNWNSIVAGKVYTSVVKVRKDKVEAYLDGKLISEWKTDYSDMGMNEGWKLRGAKLGLGAYASRAVFHVVEVVEVSGKGK